MAADWYFAKGKQQFGPVDAAELKRLASTGGLSPDDLIRKAGMKQWVRASSARQLFSSQLSPDQVSPANEATKPAAPAPVFTSESQSAVILNSTDRFLNTCNQWLEDWTLRGGTWAPFCKRVGYLVQWVQMLAGTRLPDGSKRTPTRACYTVFLFGFLSAAFLVANTAVEGIAYDTKSEYSVGYEFTRDGNRINLNQVEEKVRLHETKVKRQMTPLEKGFCYVGSCACGVGALWCGWKLITCGSRSVP